MGHLLGLRWLFLLLLFSNVETQKKPTLSIDTICLGNVMRVDVGPLGGKLLEVAASINNSVVVITPSLASQCGFRVKTEKPGNTMIYASLPNCFAQNVEDKMFTTTLQLRVHGNRFAEDELYQVTETCHYTAWASREIICNQNFMEVSVKRAAPHDYTLPKPSIPQASGQSVTSRRAAEKLPIDAGFRLTTVVFFTPAGEKTMSVADAHRNGYGIGNTPTRLVLRSPMMAPETYTQHFAGVTMRVFKTSIIFEKKWLASQIDATAACPMKEGSVFFTSDTITWYLPRQIDPMISSEHFNLLEVHFGLDGQRLNAETMHARQYSLSLNDLYIVVQIPIGAVGGHYKSHIQQNQYHVSYVIEPMLEMLWAEDSPHEQTRYKVLFHIATHLLPRPLQLVDETVPAEQVFKLVLGHFALDVALINISFPSEVLTLTDCRARGFNIMEHISVNGSTKIFALQVPFTDPAVSKMGDGVVAYSLHLTFGLLVLDSFVTFSHTAHVEAVSPNMALPPSVSGGCDHQNFYVLVKYGSQSFRFQTTVGKQLLTPSLAQHYNYMENGTHFSFTVPFSASDVAVEAVKSSSIRSRLNVVLSNPETKSEIQDFSLVCNFPSGLTECFPNGTMTALAVKVDSVPALNPRLLTLQDPTCGPVYSDDHYAYFVFTVNSCGTTRKFLPDSMLYENEISLPDELEMKPGSDSEEPEYELKISCIYDINTSHAVAFYTRLRRSEPYAENSTGLLQIEMRLSLDNFYSTFQTVEDYPIAKYLQQPLYFEVQLMGSTNPKVSLELENCWATQDEDRNSHPRWNLIINGCPNPVDTYQVVFHPVQADSRVQYPSHFKRFEVQMFAFAEGEDDLNGQLFVHCDIVICDAKNPLGGVCGGQCPNPESSARGQRHVSDFHDFSHVSAGPIIIN